MNNLAQDLVFVAAKRTPFGAYGGGLKDQTATDLGVQAAKAALESGGVDAGDIDAVVFGNVLQTAGDAIYLGRHVGLRSGVPQHVGGLTVNRLCGSGFQAIVNGAQEILTGQARTVLCGGAESMSQAPHVIRGARWGIRLGQAPMTDALWECLHDPVAGVAMSGTAENLATDYGIGREEADVYAATSQTRFAAAQECGWLDAELAPVTWSTRKGEVTIDRDEHNRPGTTAEQLGKLRPAFSKEGIITAGNASGICDGAGALVLTTAERASDKGWNPLARLVSWGITGCDPTRMGIGPVGAIRNALRMADLEIGDLDLVEVNEAFAPQYIAVERELGLDRDRTNVDGGAIAVGHPLAASGARITAHLIHALRRREASLGCGSACIGGGQGIALVVEAMA